MSPSSRESNLAQLREALLQLNSEFFLTLKERRGLCLKIQEYKKIEGTYSHYNPEREKMIFTQLNDQLSDLSIKELLAFSLVMEDHAMAMAPGSYPSWSQYIHLSNPKKELIEMINPLLLKISRPKLYTKINLAIDFQFLREF